MTNKATKIITYILLVLAVITVIGVIARFTNGFTSDFKTFYVTVDGESKSFQSETDMTAAFVIDKSEKSFTVKPKGKTLTEVLTAFYGKEVTDCENKGYTDMFTLIVTSYNGEASVKVNFAVAGKVTGVSFDKAVITF